MNAWLAWLALFFSIQSVAFAKEEFPRPVSWEANLQNVKIADVIGEFSPALPVWSEIETKFTAKLRAKGLLYAKGEGDFAILTPSVICAPVVGSTSADAACQVSLTLRERVAPAASATPGKRLASGIVGTFHSHFTQTFPQNENTLRKALDVLFEAFVARLKSTSPE